MGDFPRGIVHANYGSTVRGCVFGGGGVGADPEIEGAGLDGPLMCAEGSRSPSSLVSRVRETVCFSPGLRVTRRKALSSRTGRDALPERWCV